MTENKTLIGFDFGTKYLGIAVGQTVTKTASPLSCIKIEAGLPSWEILDVLITKWKPHALVVGLPIRIKKEKSDIVAQTKQFIHALKSHYKLPVYAVDEHLTTIEAKAQLFSQSGYRGLKKEHIDSYAAKLILEDWLQSYNLSHKPFTE